MSPPNDKSHLYEQFQLWLHRPDAVPRREGADTAPCRGPDVQRRNVMGWFLLTAALMGFIWWLKRSVA